MRIKKRKENLKKEKKRKEKKKKRKRKRKEKKRKPSISQQSINCVTSEKSILTSILDVPLTFIKEFLLMFLGGVFLTFFSKVMEFKPLSFSKEKKERKKYFKKNYDK